MSVEEVNMDEQREQSCKGIKAPAHKILYGLKQTGGLADGNCGVEVTVTAI